MFNRMVFNTLRCVKLLKNRPYSLIFRYICSLSFLGARYISILSLTDFWLRIELYIQSLQSGYRAGFSWSTSTNFCVNSIFIYINDFVKLSLTSIVQMHRLSITLFLFLLVIRIQTTFNRYVILIYIIERIHSLNGVNKRTITFFFKKLNLYVSMLVKNHQLSTNYSLLVLRYWLQDLIDQFWPA